MRDGLIQGVARHVLHGNEIGAGGLIDVVNSDDVGVIESRSGLGFVDEAALPFGVADFFRRKKLERYEAVQAHVARLPDDSHSACAQLLDNAVMRDRLSDHDCGIKSISGPIPMLICRDNAWPPRICLEEYLALPVTEGGCECDEGKVITLAVPGLHAILAHSQRRASSADSSLIRRARAAAMEVFHGSIRGGPDGAIEIIPQATMAGA